jgi:hypothetical protein
MTRRGFIVAALTAAFALPAVAFAAARTVPQSTGAYLLGGRMIRAEIVVKSDAVFHDFQLDRGRLVRRYAKNVLTLAERDGTRVSVRTASSANVTLNGKSSNLRALRAGMQIAVSHDRDLPADTVYASSATAPAPKLPKTWAAFLLGPRMVRAEIALQTADNALHDYRLDQGRVRQVTSSGLVLRELDNPTVAVAVAPTARVRLNGQIASLSQLKRGMTASAMRDGDKAADQVWATTK